MAERKDRGHLTTPATSNQRPRSGARFFTRQSGFLFGTPYMHKLRKRAYIKRPRVEAAPDKDTVTPKKVEQALKHGSTVIDKTLARMKAYHAAIETEKKTTRRMLDEMEKQRLA